MSFLVPSDFTGRFAIAQAYNGDTAKLQSYIDTYEVQYLTQLLGAELYDLFIEGFNNDEEIYVKLFDAFSFDSEREGRPLISQGMLEMLKGFVYTHYINGDLETTTTTGNVILEAEGGKKVTDALLGVKAPMGAVSLGAQLVSRNTNDDAAPTTSGTITGTAMEVDYSLSKRTAVTAYVKKADQPVGTLANDSTEFGFGVGHTF